RGTTIAFDHTIGQFQFWKLTSQRGEFFQYFCTHPRSEDFVQFRSLLWREQTEPNSPHLPPFRPETHELFKIPLTTCHLSGDGAMNGDRMSGDISQNSVVSRGGSPDVMLRL